MINGFRDEYAFLSNFYATPVPYNGIVYPNSEAAFQAAKFAHLTPDDVKKSVDASIIEGCNIDLTDNRCIEHLFATLSPGVAKKLGRKLPMRRDWDSVKYDIMREIVYNKFTANADLKQRLLNTGDEEIIEKNWWHDNIWGNCACYRCEHIKGKNMLGIILMETRDRLK